MADARDQTISDLQESLACARQNEQTARARIERIAIAMTREGCTKMAHEAALQIEDTFARGGMSRDQRLLNVQKAIQRVIMVATQGEKYWQD